jgi:glycosyltransferase involved in cell wall biosynthesis
VTPLRVLSAGPVTWQQGFEHSVHAVRLALDLGVECEYRIAGEGDHLVAVAFARHQLRLSDHVELLPSDGSAGLLEELRMADVFVDPAVTDDVPTEPVVAARKLGVPVVATPRPGLPPDIAVTVPRRDPRAIAEALATLV